MPVGGVCSYCRMRRAVNRDHVVPRSVLRRLEVKALGTTGRMLLPSGEWITEELRELVGACFECNIAKGSRLLIPPSWADRLDELNALGIGTFRVWDGSPKALREVCK